MLFLPYKYRDKVGVPLFSLSSQDHGLGGSGPWKGDECPVQTPITNQDRESVAVCKPSFSSLTSWNQPFPESNPRVELPPCA